MNLAGESFRIVGVEKGFRPANSREIDSNNVSILAQLGHDGRERSPVKLKAGRHQESSSHVTEDPT
jgi:hypothetical protein